MSRLFLCLGPQSEIKKRNIENTLNMYKNIYCISTLDIHLMLNTFRFKDYGENGYMKIAYKMISNIILELCVKDKDIILKDWYFSYASLEKIIDRFDITNIKIYDNSLYSYLAYMNKNKYNKDIRFLPDILDEIDFYEKYKIFINSPLLEKIEKSSRVSISKITIPDKNLVL
jgi:hypothetical protein